MKILLINPPYQTITSNLGVGHQVLLGLLSVGGPLIDAGHEVRLLDAECRRLGTAEVVREVRQWAPHVVMMGHAGSTPAHPVCVRLLRAVKAEHPGVVTVYGGVYPTYHAERILARERAVDVIVRGEGEATATALVRALEASRLAPGAAPAVGCRPRLSWQRRRRRPHRPPPAPRRPRRLARGMGADRDEASSSPFLPLLPRFKPLPASADAPCTSSGTAWRTLD
jgi:radical SAM superfamily enzyme YgiQ (UPF0313 family)